MKNWKDIPCSQIEAISITEIFLKLVKKSDGLAIQKNSIRLFPGVILINDHIYLEKQACKNNQKNPEKEGGGWQKCCG